MATEIVNEEAAELAHIAAHEITLLAVTLGRYIRDSDTTGEIAPVARGMLDRVIRLAEAVDDFVGFTDGDFDTVKRAVLCQR